MIGSSTGTPGGAANADASGWRMTRTAWIVRTQSRSLGRGSDALARAARQAKSWRPTSASPAACMRSTSSGVGTCHDVAASTALAAGRLSSR
jgi:hypothetical protein